MGLDAMTRRQEIVLRRELVGPIGDRNDVIERLYSAGYRVLRSGPLPTPDAPSKHYDLDRFLIVVELSKELE